VREILLMIKQYNMMQKLTKGMILPKCTLIVIA